MMEEEADESEVEDGDITMLNTEVSRFAMTIAQFSSYRIFIY